MVLGAYRAAQKANNKQPSESVPANSTFANTPAGILEGIIVGRYESEMQSGKTLIHSAEAGGVTEFSVGGELSPSDVVEIAMEALAWLKDQPDPLNPPLYPSRRIKRLRVSFAKAVT